MRYQNYISMLRRSSVLDEGNMSVAAHAVLDCAARALYLSDASVWLLDDNGDMVCSFFLDQHGNQKPKYSVMGSDQVEQMLAQLGDGTHLSLTYTDASKISWLSNIDLFNNNVLLVPIFYKGHVVGLLQSVRVNHQGNFDESACIFATSLSDLLGRAILATQKGKLESALKQANIELEKKILKRNQELKKTLKDLKAAQGHIIESEKMSALGQLVCGVAHEVNTPLGIAITALSILDDAIASLQKSYDEQTLDEDAFIQFMAKVKPAIKMSSDNLGRAAKLVQDFKQTSVDQAHNVIERIPLKKTLDSVIGSLSPIYKRHDADVILDIPEDLEVRTYSGAIDQILINLINNSCVHGFAQSVQEKHLIFIKVFVIDGSFVIDYQDNGVGISDEVAKHIFTPFYTTNRDGGGSGLGMSVIYNLVQHKLGGEIRVVEEGVSFGAHFQICLPIDVANKPS